MAREDDELTLTFRCPRGLEGLLPPPTPATAGVPAWFKAMPQEAASAIDGRRDDTLKRCPPFIDAMTCGFLMPLMCDVTVENGAFSWDSGLPPADGSGLPRAPIGLHDPSQAAGAPLFDADRFLIKFHNLWTIRAPPGWSILFTHPANRFDLPFTTLSGLVDCDVWGDAFINFPAHWHDASFCGVLPRGAPVAQCVPVRRERWTLRAEAFSEADAERTRALNERIGREKGVYRRRFTP